MEGTLLLNLEGEVPAKIALDGLAFELAPRFKGFCSVARGFHVLRAGGKDDGRNFYFFMEGAVSLIRMAGEMSLVAPGEPEYAAHLQALRSGDLARCLMPLPSLVAAAWRSCAGGITPQVLAESAPTDGGHDLTFPLIDISVREVCRGAAPRQVTALGTDRSSVLRRHLQEHESAGFEGLLGRMQLAFLCVQLENSLEAWRFWQSATFLLAESHAYRECKPDDFGAFLTLLRRWLTGFPDDFFYSQLTRDNFLAPVISHLMEECSGVERFRADVEAIGRVLRKRFGFEWENVLSDPEHGVISNALSDESPSIIDINQPFIRFD